MRMMAEMALMVLKIQICLQVEVVETVELVVKLVHY
jgi:hypothetical protein